MKLKNKYIAIAALGVMGLTSCSDTLNVESPSQMDANMVYSSAEFATNAHQWRICIVLRGPIYKSYVRCLDAEH